MTSHDIEVMDGDLVDHSAGMELEPMRAQAPVTLFRSDDPNEIVARATETANALSAVVKAKKLTTRIGQSDHVRVEGWTLLGTMLGVFPVCVWTRKTTNPEGWEARVEARTLGGLVVGAAEAQCTRDEGQWSFQPKGRDGRKLPPRDDYALRSMAQTRATSKALRQPLGFVMTLAGFDPTPAEEMPRSDFAAPEAKISTDQRTRLHAIATEHKVPTEEVKRIIASVAGVDSSTKIPVSKYDDVCDKVADWVPF